MHHQKTCLLNSSRIYNPREVPVLLSVISATKCPRRGITSMPWVASATANDIEYYTYSISMATAYSNLYRTRMLPLDKIQMGPSILHPCCQILSLIGPPFRQQTILNDQYYLFEFKLIDELAKKNSNWSEGKQEAISVQRTYLQQRALWLPLC